MLNKHQKMAVMYTGSGITEAHFEGKDWFNTEAHTLGFNHLVVHKRGTDEALEILQLLDEQELTNLLLLNKSQQITLLSLHADQGLRPSDLIGKEWLTSRHSNAIGALHSKDESIAWNELIAEVENLSDAKLLLIQKFGFRRSQISDLTDIQISVLNQFKSIQSSNEFALKAAVDLNYTQSAIVSFFSECQLKAMRTAIERDLQTVSAAFEFVKDKKEAQLTKIINAKPSVPSDAWKKPEDQSSPAASLTWSNMCRIM